MSVQVPMTDATMPAAAAAVAESNPVSPPVQGSPPPALTPAAKATATQDAAGSLKSGAKMPSGQQGGNRLSGSQLKRGSPSNPSAAREKRQKVEREPTAGPAVPASEVQERHKPGTQSSIGRAGSAAMPVAATGEEPGPTRAAEPPPAKRPKLSLASLLAGKAADGMPSALRDPRALLQLGAQLFNEKLSNRSLVIMAQAGSAESAKWRNKRKML